MEDFTFDPDAEPGKRFGWGETSRLIFEDGWSDGALRWFDEAVGVVWKIADGHMTVSVL